VGGQCFVRELFGRPGADQPGAPLCSRLCCDKAPGAADRARRPPECGTTSRTSSRPRDRKIAGTRAAAPIAGSGPDRGFSSRRWNKRSPQRDAGWQARRNEPGQGRWPPTRRSQPAKTAARQGRELPVSSDLFAGGRSCPASLMKGPSMGGDFGVGRDGDENLNEAKKFSRKGNGLGGRARAARGDLSSGLRCRGQFAFFPPTAPRMRCRAGGQKVTVPGCPSLQLVRRWNN
jgi:hypothetical protein